MKITTRPSNLLLEALSLIAGYAESQESTLSRPASALGCSVQDVEWAQAQIAAFSQQVIGSISIPGVPLTRLVIEADAAEAERLRQAWNTDPRTVEFDLIFEPNEPVIQAIKELTAVPD